MDIKPTSMVIPNASEIFNKMPAAQGTDTQPTLTSPKEPIPSGSEPLATEGNLGRNINVRA